MTGEAFVRSLVAEAEALFAHLGEGETLEAESGGRVEMVTLLELALQSEIEASELAGLWVASTPEIEAKALLAEQCADEMKHYRLITERLRELGHEVAAEPATPATYSPLYHYLRGLRSTVERLAGGPFAREAIAKVRNLQFIDFCRQAGDQETLALYRDVIQPEEVKHHEMAGEVLARLCDTAEKQRLAAEAARTTLAIADELRTLAEKRTGLHPIPAS